MAHIRRAAFLGTLQQQELPQLRKQTHHVNHTRRVELFLYKTNAHSIVQQR